MKTLEIKSGKITGLSALILSAAFSFLLSGCQKDELASPNSSISTTSNDNAKVAANPNLNAFRMLVINHSAAQTNMPDYKIEVYTSGKVTFEGRRNTAFIGTQTMQVSQEIIQNLKSMFLLNRFVDIKGSIETSPDLPIITTTFRNDINSEPVSLNDDNANNPMALIDLRRNAEQTLNLETLIYPNHTRNNQPQQMPIQHN